MSALVPHGDVLTILVFAAMAAGTRVVRWVYDAGYCRGVDQARRDAQWAREHRCHHPSSFDFEPYSVLPERYIEDHAHGGFQP